MRGEHAREANQEGWQSSSQRRIKIFNDRGQHTKSCSEFLKDEAVSFDSRKSQIAAPRKKDEVMIQEMYQSQSCSESLQ